MTPKLDLVLLYMKFSFVKRIDTSKNSIFYSLIKKNNVIVAFGRNKYNEIKIKKNVLDESFNVIEDDNIIFKGEDPRCFEYNNKIYILDNFFNDMHLIDYDDMKYIRINISGKNHFLIITMSCISFIL